MNISTYSYIASCATVYYTTANLSYCLIFLKGVRIEEEGEEVERVSRFAHCVQHLTIYRNSSSR